MVQVLRVDGIMAVGKVIAIAEEAYCKDECLQEDPYGEVQLNGKGWERVQRAFKFMSKMCELFEKTDLSAQFLEISEQKDRLSQQSFYLALDFFDKAFEESSVLLLENAALKHYDQLEYFGEEVFNAFPSVIQDITASGSCFAVRQYTASVFHALRAIELPLTRMARNFGVQEIKNWNSALNDLEKLVRDRDNSKTIPNWEAEKDFYTDAINHLFAIKNAWRNYTMHLHLRFNREECEEVLLSARAFMRKAAKIVPEQL